MKNSFTLIEELKKHNSIVFYPSSGTDLSDIDYFCSGGLPREERKKANGKPSNWCKAFSEPETFVHSDVNFYMEFEAGKDLDLSELGIHSPYEILSFTKVSGFEKPNKINNNSPYSGGCFKYELKIWGKEKPVFLFFCLCENEFIASEVFLKNNIKLDYVWSKNWNGGKTYGTWLGRSAGKFGVKLFYTDWLCLPDQRGEPSNSLVYEKYPELFVKNNYFLKRTDNHWIEEGAHGWVDEFAVEI